VKQISAGSHLKDTNTDLREPTSYEVTDVLKQQKNRAECSSNSQFIISNHNIEH